MAEWKLIRVLNNNAILAGQEDGRECVLLGKGIGFQSVSDQGINMELVSKRYNLSSHKEAMRYAYLLETIQPELFELAEKHIANAKRISNKDFQPVLVLTLADHLSSMLERAKAHAYLKNGMLWDMKRLYRDEYQLGLDIIAEFNQLYGTVYDENEAATIAQHFVNASSEGDWGNVQNVAKIINEILEIVRRYFSLDYDEDSYTYYRFVVHLRFFAQRVLGREVLETFDDAFIREYISGRYQDSYNCSLAIKKYIKNTYQHEINGEECLYLTTHIVRVNEESKKK